MVERSIAWLAGRKGGLLRAYRVTSDRLSRADHPQSGSIGPALRQYLLARSPGRPPLEAGGPVTFIADSGVQFFATRQRLASWS
jgi:hypothetical protein